MIIQIRETCGNSGDTRGDVRRRLNKIPRQSVQQLLRSFSLNRSDETINRPTLPVFLFSLDDPPNTLTTVSTGILSSDKSGRQ